MRLPDPLGVLFVLRRRLNAYHPNPRLERDCHGAGYRAEQALHGTKVLGRLLLVAEYPEPYATDPTYPTYPTCRFLHKSQIYRTACLRFVYA